MEEIGIHMVGIWNPENWNLESNTSADSVTWGESNIHQT